MRLVVLLLLVLLRVACAESGTKRGLGSVVMPVERMWRCGRHQSGASSGAAAGGFGAERDDNFIKVLQCIRFGGTQVAVAVAAAVLRRCRGHFLLSRSETLARRGAPLFVCFGENRAAAAAA